jgi:hypothetical protein
MRISLCRRCGKQFRFRAGKHYCSDICRVTTWRETAQACFYCGVPADTVDHVPPRIARPLLIEHNVTRWKFVEVPACQECNSYLGARQPWDLAGRKAMMKQFLRRRYRAFVEMPEWTDEEKTALGRGLSDFVTESQVLARLIRARLAW